MSVSSRKAETHIKLNAKVAADGGGSKESFVDCYLSGSHVPEQ